MAKLRIVPRKFTFTVISVSKREPLDGKSCAFLYEDNWDDWGKFRTQFRLVVFDSAGEKHDVGDVKIGQFGLVGSNTAVAGKTRKPNIPSTFVELGSEFFSLGQDDGYYETLGKLDDEPLRLAIVHGLKDVVADNTLWKRALNEVVMGESLLRSVKHKNVEEQFRRLLAGGARLSAFRFSYTQPTNAGAGPPACLSFSVSPGATPPTNIHVIIGRNGVGKSYTLHQMTNSLVQEENFPEDFGHFTSGEGDGDDIPFANLVSVSFSAFDNFDLLPERRDRSHGLLYSYIGLRYPADDESAQPKTPQMLSGEFVTSVKICLNGARRPRWLSALAALEADPIFKEAQVATRLSEADDFLEDFNETAGSLFQSLSSGHKIVLLTIVRLVETVDEKTLVLLDEPEGHLHPPLLSAFVRALSDLLMNRNGVAVIATHSPVVLQEVPKECVWKLRRTGSTVTAERPEIETFGENVGILTREVFGLEVAQSGFHQLLQNAAVEHSSYDQALEHFDSKLGAEARAILRGLFLSKESGEE